MEFYDYSQEVKERNKKHGVTVKTVENIVKLIVGIWMTFRQEISKFGQATASSVKPGTAYTSFIEGSGYLAIPGASVVNAI